MKVFYILSVLLYVVISEKVNYEGYKVFKYTPKNEEEVAILKQYQLDTKYMFWKDVRNVGLATSIMVGPENIYEFEQEMKQHGLKWELTIDNVQTLIDNQKVTKLENSNEFTWDSYHTLDDINAWLYSMAEEYPNYAEIVISGHSYEGRDVVGLKLKFKETDKVAIIEAGIHSREWISPATATYAIHQFLTSKDPEIRYVAELFEWHIFPVINPDGYVFTFNGNRMWRKNRSLNEGDFCNGQQSYGTDLNRNFDWYWMVIGASNNSCTEIFAGTAPFSEIEAKTFADYVYALGDRVKMYLSLHSFGQMLLLPFSQTEPRVFLGNYPDVFEIGVRALDHVEALFGTDYIIGTAPDTLGSIGGDASDWAKGTLDIDVVYCYELRGLEDFGFLLPADQILPNNLEFMVSVVGIVEYGQEIGYFPDDSRDPGNSSFKNEAFILPLLLSFVLYLTIW